MLSKGQIDYMLKMMYSADVLRKELADGAVWELIVAGNRTCGYLSYLQADDNSVKLSKIYIMREFRGRAIVTVALNRVKDYAALNGWDYVFLTVNRNNRRAIRAYEKNGFVIADSVVVDIGGGFVMDDYIMKCFVNTPQ